MARERKGTSADSPSPGGDGYWGYIPGLLDDTRGTIALSALTRSRSKRIRQEAKEMRAITRKYLKEVIYRLARTPDPPPITRVDETWLRVLKGPKQEPASGESQTPQRS